MSTVPKTAIVWINLGTPQHPTARAVRRYLKEFLSDQRVVELPRFLWQIILRGIVLPFRSGRVAKKYAEIWMEEGSPLKVITEKQALLLGEHLAEQEVSVHFAMRYGQPGIAEVLKNLQQQAYARVLIFSAYPQYACSTTAAVIDAVSRFYAKERYIPELRFINNYATHPGYIKALSALVKDHEMLHGRSEILLLSFHGTPERMRRLGDPYYAQCQKTAQALAAACELSAYRVSFQSRFGGGAWLTPSTTEVIQELGRAGIKRIDVLCPGFTSDCLETLEEIALSEKESFLEAGGECLRLIPCLNTHPVWISALADIAKEHLWAR